MDKNKCISCPYTKKCGGCDYVNLPYSEQLSRKQQIAESFLGEIARENKCVIRQIVPADEPLYYRNKVHSVFSRDRNGRIIRGLYREDSHDVVNVSGCLLEDRTADAIIEEIKRLLPSFKLKVYDEDTGFGWLRHVLVRSGNNGDSREYMVILVTAEIPFPGKNNFIKALRTKFPEIVTIVQNINNKKTSMVLGERNITLYGKGFIEDDTPGLKFRISPGSFYQINSAQTKKLYSLALEMASLTGKERVLDAYCGTGTIGMFMSSAAGSVVGVELNRDAVRDAIANARAGKIQNISFVNSDATEYMKALSSDRSAPQFDVLCMDPPRSGSTPVFIAAVRDLGIPRIVYVSCNPETLAADLKTFMLMGYNIKRIAPVDMFPGTKHVESVVLLSRKNIDDTLELTWTDKEFGNIGCTADYDAIKSYVKETFGLNVSSLYIAQMKEKFGINERENYNIGAEGHKVPQCPKEKEEAILKAFEHFKLI